MTPAAQAQCARYGVETLEDVLRIKVAEGLDPVDAMMAIVQEQLDAEKAERDASRTLAHKVICPYCGAEPGAVCRRVRGRNVGRDLTWPYGSVREDWHRSRYVAAMDAEVAELVANGP